MKVQVLVSKPKSLDITLNEMMEKWHMLELIPGLECHFILMTNLLHLKK